MHIKLTEPYRKRPTRIIDTWAIAGFSLKVYGISYSGDIPDDQLCKAAREITGQRLLASAVDTNHYGGGFVGIHAGRGGNFVFIDWWADENELHHHVYVSSAETPLDLAYMTPTGLIACTWDMRVIAFERDAWVEHVLKRYHAPDVQGYLNTTLNEDVQAG